MSVATFSQGARASSPASSARSNRSRVVVLLPPSVLALGFCAYVIYAWSLGLNRNVWLVNGLDREYDVSVNGKVHHLLAHDTHPIKLSEGDVTIASADAAVPLPGQTVRLSTPLLTRPFAKPMFVLNPDRTAIVYEEEALFVRETPKSPDDLGRHCLMVGQSLYQFAKVDYPFGEFPASVASVDGASSVNKKKVALWTLGTFMQQVQLIEKEIGHDDAVTFAQQTAIANPDNQSALMLLATVMPHQQVVGFLRTRLDIRPVQVLWHRTYQQLVAQIDPQYDLVSEYRARAKAEPEDSSLMYLLARVVPDRAESERWLRKSTHCAYPSGYGFFALAYRALSRGDFENALIEAQQAAALLPDNLDAKAVETQALAATGHYDRLLNRFREAQAHTPLDPAPALQEIQLLAFQQDIRQAQRVRDAFVSRASAPGRGAVIRQFEVASTAMLQYARGDMARFLAALEHGPLTASERFEYDLSLDRLDDAAADLSTSPVTQADAHLTLAVAALDAGRDDLASRQFQLASAGYALGDTDMKRISQWLTQIDPPNPDDVCDVALMPDQKRLLLAAFGLKDPDHRDRYFKAAAELNYDHAFPYLTVKRVLTTPLLALK